MDELEKLRQEKLAQLQNQQAGEEEFASKFAQLEELVKERMTPDARSRYGNLRVAHEQLCIQALVQLSKLIQMGRIQKVDDKTFKLVLMQLQDKKRDMNIKFR